MSAFLSVSGSPNIPGTTNTRTYYIAAQMEYWDYAPRYIRSHSLWQDRSNPLPFFSQMNQITGEAVGSTIYDAFLVANSRANGATVTGTLGRLSWTARYWQYPNENFNYNEAVRTHPAPFEHLGILGPLIRAEVGDKIVVVFYNNLTFNASFTPQGLLLQNGDDGFGVDGTGRVVAPGSKYTYTFRVPSSAGPGSNDPSR
jgi:hypothetical protein